MACINELIKKAVLCTKPSPRFAYLAPYYTQAKDVAWEYIKSFTANIPNVKTNESELKVILPNGAAIRLYGAENAERMRGLYFDGIIVDEPADIRPSVFPEIIRPALADRKGWCVFIGTPKGRNAFYRVWMAAQTDDSWYALMLKASETGYVDPEELEATKKEMTEAQYAQEFECSFDAAVVGAYYGSLMTDAMQEGRIGIYPHVKGQLVHTAWDIGRKDPTSIWFWQDMGGHIRVIDYYENTQKSTDHYANILQRKGYDKGYQYGEHWLPHDVKVSEWGSGSRIETLVGLGIKPQITPNISIEDGINATMLTIPHCYFNESTTQDGLEGLRLYRAQEDEKKARDAHTPFTKPKPYHDWASNPADAFRYLAIAWRKKRGILVTEPRGINQMTYNELLRIHDEEASSFEERI